MDEAEVAVGDFIVLGYQALRVFELVKALFDHVVQSVDCGIDR